MPDKGAKVGRYTIVERIGEGGMGEVYAVLDDQLDRRVALKLVKGGGTASARARMLGEAQAMAKLSHPNVVPVFEVGEHDEQLFLVMEFVEGRTLRQWREEGKHGWAQVVLKYIDAGRGLAAAHAQGLVHRDFKPDNAVVGRDERVRVLDFGLAARRDVVDVGGTPSQGTPSPGAPITESGSVMGTPAYMAPEQFLGEPVDPRTDQFAFCVALWEALYARRPFSGEAKADLFNAVSNGEIVEPPPNDVPAAVRRHLERGLQPRPDDRWRSLDGLLRKLSYAADAGRRRRRRIAGGFSLAAAAIGGVWAVDTYNTWTDRDNIAACEEVSAKEIAELWSPDVDTQVRDGLLSTGVKHAAATAERAVPRLQAYAASLQRARAEACVDHQVTEAWDDAMFDRAQWCLEQRAVAFEVLVDDLREANAHSISAAVEAVIRLPAPKTCREEALLRRRPPPPPPQDRAAAREVLVSLRRAGAAAGGGEAPLEVAEDALERAKHLGNASLIAAAQLQRGVLLRESGDYERAASALEGAFFAAATSHDFELAAEAALLLMRLVGELQGRRERGRHWGRLAALMLDELGAEDDHSTRAELSNMESVLLGYNEAALPGFERAREIWKRTLGPEHINVARANDNIARVLATTGKHDAAATLFEQVLAVREEALGPEHPSVAATLQNLAWARHRVGRSDDALALMQRGVELVEVSVGPEHPLVSDALEALGSLQRERGELGLAEESLTRALVVRERKLGANHPSIARIAGELARVARLDGRLDDAKTFHERALALFESVDDPQAATHSSGLGLIAYAEGRFAEAAERAKHARGLLIDAEGDFRLALALVDTRVAMAKEQLGEIDEAETLCRRALAVLEAQDGGKPGKLAARFVLAKIAYARGGERADALATAEEILADLRQQKPANDDLTAEIRAWIAVR